MSRYSLTVHKKNRQQQPTNERENSRGKPRVISFVGSMQENIRDIVASAKCCQGCELREVLQIFGKKIETLRTERDELKQKYVQDVYDLHRKLRLLEEENTRMKDAIGGSLEQSVARSQYEADFMGLSYTNSQESLSEPEQQHDENLENIRKIVVKYNIGEEELEETIKQYLGLEQKCDPQGEQIRKLRTLCRKLTQQREKRQLRDKISNFLKPSRQN